MKITVTRTLTQERLMEYVFDLTIQMDVALLKKALYRGEMQLDGDDESGVLVMEDEEIGHYEVEYDDDWEETDDQWDNAQVVAEEEVQS